MRNRDFPKRGLSLEYLKDMLTITLTPMSFTEYWNTSMTQHKHTFLNYLHWLVEKKYLETMTQRMTVGSGRWSETGVLRKCTIYQTTPYGRKFLEMIT